jgi:hypothetical protein
MWRIVFPSMVPDTTSPTGCPGYWRYSLECSHPGGVVHICSPPPGGETRSGTVPPSDCSKMALRPAGRPLRSFFPLTEATALIC